MINLIRICLLAVLIGAAPAPRGPRPCPRCGWTPPETTATITVGSVDKLQAAVAAARPGTSILLRDGVYRLDQSLDIKVSDVVIRGQSGDRSKVVIRGPGVDEQRIGAALSVSAPGVTIADLSIGLVAYHGVQVRGERGADRVVLHNLRIVDTGQQLVKGSRSKGTPGPHKGLLACSTLEYTNHAPSSYANGVDVLGGSGWVVRDNVFRRIRGPASESWRAGPAILFWRGSRDTIVERNLVLDCHRGIALGLQPESGSGEIDHQGGLIRRNTVSNLNSWADEAIEVNACPSVLIEHNTVLVKGQVPWSISVRFPSTSAVVRNNLTNLPVISRNDGRVEKAGNIEDAKSDWFCDAARGDLRLSRGDLPPIDRAVPSPGVDKPHQGSAPDVGAFEFEGRSLPDSNKSGSRPDPAP